MDVLLSQRLERRRSPRPHEVTVADARPCLSPFIAHQWLSEPTGAYALVHHDAATQGIKSAKCPTWLLNGTLVLTKQLNET